MRLLSGTELGRAFSGFAVIVVGVLTALSVESLWSYRNDRVTEAEYLEQLIADARYNVGRLEESTDLEERHAAAAVRLLAGVSRTTPPTLDSVKVWLGLRDGSWWVSDPRLRLGTITALVETGDLNLLTEARVRSAVLAYQGQIGSDLEEFRRFLGFGHEARRSLTLRGATRLTPQVPPGAEVGARRMIAIHGDPEGRVALEQLVDAYHERIWYLNQMREATETLLGVLSVER